MATDTPYLRQARLTVWPGNGGQGQVFFSDGSRDSYYLSFDITRSLIDVANESSFTLKNLTDQTRQKLQTGFSKVMLEAGWSSGKMSTFYVGNLMRAVSVRQGPDIVTTLLCVNAGIDGFEPSRLQYRRTLDFLIHHN